MEAQIENIDKQVLSEVMQEIIKNAGGEHLLPIGAEALQELMLKEGVEPEDCSGSRGVIEMRKK